MASRCPWLYPRTSLFHTLSFHETGRLQTLGDGVEVDVGCVEGDDASVRSGHGRL